MSCDYLVPKYIVFGKFDPEITQHITNHEKNTAILGQCPQERMFYPGAN